MTTGEWLLDAQGGNTRALNDVFCTFCVLTSPVGNVYTGVVVNAFADYKVNLLLISNCKCGLVVTWQTSVARDAVMSHILLFCVVKPPMWQTMA